MKTNRSYLAKAKEIRDIAQGAKKAVQQTITLAGVSTISKKGKHPTAFGGPSEPRVPEVTMVPSTSIAALVTILVIDLDDAEGHSSPAVGVPAVASLPATPPTTFNAPPWRFLLLQVRWLLPSSLRFLLLSLWHCPQLYPTLHLLQLKRRMTRSSGQTLGY